MINWMPPGCNKVFNYTIPGVYGATYDQFPLRQLINRGLQIKLVSAQSKDTTNLRHMRCLIRRKMLPKLYSIRNKKESNLFLDYFIKIIYLHLSIPSFEPLKSTNLTQSACMNDYCSISNAATVQKAILETTSITATVVCLHFFSKVLILTVPEYE